MNLVNLQRDTSWINLSTGSALTWSTGDPLTASTPRFNNSGMVNMDVGMAHARNTVTLTKGTQVAMGCLMYQTVGDNIPFRVKATCTLGAALIVGYAGPSPTGLEDEINNPVYFPFVNVFDDIVMVPPHAIGFENRALAFAVASTAEQSGEVLIAQLSVQTLAIKAPTMQNAVS